VNPLDLMQSLNIRALYHQVVRHDHRITKLEERMAALEDGLAAVEVETTRIANWITANLPSDPAIAAKFAPVLEHLRALGASDNPVPEPPAGLTLPDAPAAA
jgi:hypothetical protein